MNLEFFVANRKLTAKRRTFSVSDSMGRDTFSIGFDQEWDGLVKIVVLQNGENKVQVLYTGKTAIPRQVCGRGELFLTCFGYRGKDDGAAVIYTKPMIHPVRMDGPSAAEADAVQPFSPSLVEQMSAVVADAEKAAAQATEIGARLLRLQEQGAFQGAQGPAGLAATVQVESVRRGEREKVENLGTDRNAVLRFTLPFGLTEKEKAELKEQIVGDIDTALDSILTIEQRLIGGESL